jgi:hypothetical protein
MKTKLLLVFSAFLINSAFSQVLLPGGDLENWYTVQGIDSSYMQPDTYFFSTLNELASTPGIGAPAGPVTVYRVGDAHSGNYAAKLVSNTFPYIPTNIFIPGMLGTTQLLMLQNTIRIGKPCPYGCNPTHFTGWFKFSPVQGDSSRFLIVVSGTNSETHLRDTIAYGDTTIHGTVANWTPFDIKVVKNPTVLTTPDTLSILCVSSAGFSVANLHGGVGQIGSTLYVDDLYVDYPNGIEQVLMPEVSVTTYPDPARDILTVGLSSKVKNASLDVYTLDGKFMGRFAMPEMTNAISVTGLPSGTYYYKLTDGKSAINTGSFIIQR